MYTTCRFPFTRVHSEYLSSLLLRNWGKLTSLHVTNRVVGYCRNTLGHALVSGKLKNLVTLDVQPFDGLDPGYLDSDVYRWCTPLLENLSVSISKGKAVTRRMLRQRKFFVNLPRLLRLSVTFEHKSDVQLILENIPEHVSELKLSVGCRHREESLPLVFQPGLTRLSIRGFQGNLGNLHLQYRHASFSSMDHRSV
jgi:hypothetical protein